jgi:hypothetical protein
MKTRRPTPNATAQPSTQNAARGNLQKAALRTPPRMDLERPQPSSDPGAIEYASWLRLLRQPAP